MKPVNIGILGLGTVGTGTVNILNKNCSEIERRTGFTINVASVLVRDKNKRRLCDTKHIPLTVDYREIVDNPDIPIVVELLGGEDDARKMVSAAIENGKHIVSANKLLIAKHGNELISSAIRKKIHFAFEASVVGGVPILQILREGLSANRILGIAGIINGTTNTVLTCMSKDQRSFEDALAEAIDLGFAEAEPSMDIDGIDAAHKLTIIAAMAYGIPFDFNKVYHEGISEIGALDINYAQQLGYRIKHLAIARLTPHGIELRVHPVFVSTRELLAHVDGVMNAVLVTGDAVGPTVYYGAGAGSYPTGGAVVADIIRIACAWQAGASPIFSPLGYQMQSIRTLPVVPMTDIESAYYLRFFAEDKPGVMADVTRILADQNISIESLLQKENAYKNGYLPVIVVTHRVVGQKIDNALALLRQLKEIHNIVRIRIETFE